MKPIYRLIQVHEGTLGRMSEGREGHGARIEREVAALMLVPLLVGRAPEVGDAETHLGATAELVIIDSPVVSRQHGVFFLAERYWLYQDLGSRNGSFLNGEPCERDHAYILRPDDELDIADQRLQVVEETTNVNRSLERSILVLDGFKFLAEFRTEALGVLLKIGGGGSEFPMAGWTRSEPCAWVEMMGEQVIVTATSGVKATVNGAPLVGPVQLNDNMQVRIGNYRLIMNDRRSPLAASKRAGLPKVQAGMTERVAGANQRSLGFGGAGALEEVASDERRRRRRTLEFSRDEVRQLLETPRQSVLPTGPIARFKLIARTRLASVRPETWRQISLAVTAGCIVVISLVVVSCVASVWRASDVPIIEMRPPPSTGS